LIARDSCQPGQFTVQDGVLQPFFYHMLHHSMLIILCWYIQTMESWFYGYHWFFV